MIGAGGHISYLLNDFACTTQSHVAGLLINELLVLYLLWFLLHFVLYSVFCVVTVTRCFNNTCTNSRHL